MASLLFNGIYAISTVLLTPGSVLTISGGVLFGPVWGTFYSLTGATIGDTTAFFIACYLASDFVFRKTGGRLRWLVEGMIKKALLGLRLLTLVAFLPRFAKRL